MESFFVTSRSYCCILETQRALKIKCYVFFLDQSLYQMISRSQVKLLQPLIDFCEGDDGLALVTQPMLQPTSELRLMVSKSIFYVDSKNVSEKFLHRHSWKNIFFQILWSPMVGFEKKNIFSGVTVEELFAYVFGIYIKNGFRNHQS